MKKAWTDSPKRTFDTVLTGDNPLVRDHRVHDLATLPGVVGLDLVCQMARSCGWAASGLRFENVIFERPIVLQARDRRQVEVVFRGDGDDLRARLRSRTVPGAGEAERAWESNLECAIRQGTTPLPALDIDAIRRSTDRSFDLDEVYAGARRLGIRHADFMKPCGTVYRGEDHLIAEVVLSQSAAKYLNRFFIHPVYLDSATLLAFAFFDTLSSVLEPKPYIPIHIKSFLALRDPGARSFVHVRRDRVRAVSSDLLYSDVQIVDERGEVCAVFEALAAKQIRSAALLVRPLSNPRDGAQPPASRHVEPERPPNGFAGPASHAPAVDRAVEGPRRIETILRHMVAQRLGRDASEIDVEVGFYEMGLQSTDLLTLAADLEARVRRELYPTLLFEHSTIAALAEYLAREGHEPAFADEAPLVDLAARVTVSSTSSAPATASAAATASAPTTMRAPTTPSAARSVDDEVAIVGMSGRYPLARDLDQLWVNLCEGRDCITEIPASRWDYRRYYSDDPDSIGTHYSKWGGFIDDAYGFDPLFFGISPRQAEVMDPQERLFLETAWAAIEDAGYTRRALAAAANGQVGVFVGVMWSDYQLFGMEEWQRGGASSASSWFSSIANRVSYVFDFKGPSVPVDTACSSSLVAFHLACDSIRRGECRQAIAGGVNLSLHPSKYVRLSEFQLLSHDGRCRSFGAGATGYVPGEGVGAVLLKPLRDAVSAGDHVYAVVRATSMNHSGRTSGFTVPSPVAQGDLIADALTKGGVDPRTIGYVEAQGTGTALGDPIEIEGLAQAFRRFTADRCFCALGSVKSNIGHLESAAGIASIAKAVLQLTHKTLVPSLHAATLNDRIDFDATPFYVQRTLTDWPSPREASERSESVSPRRVGISAFGAGGVNAHVILEEAPRQPIHGDSRAELIVLSARSEERLKASAARLKQYLEDHGDDFRLADLAYTLQVGREAMESRLAFVAHSRAEVVQLLGAYAADGAAGLPIHAHTTRRKDAPSDRILTAAGSDLDRLGAQWVQRAEVDWTRVDEDVPARRIHLPTYPFLRTPYTLPVSGQHRDAPSETMASTPSAPALAAAAPVPSTDETLIYEPRYVARELASSDTDGSVLFLVNDDEEAETARVVCARHGRDCAVAIKGRRFGRRAEGPWEIDVSESDHQHRLLRELDAVGGVPEDVIYLGGALEEGDPARDLRGLVLLTQALLARSTQAQVRLVYAFRRPPDAPAPGHAAAGGLARSLRVENPRCRYRVVELLDRVDLRTVIERALAELADSGPGVEVRYASRGREVRGLAPAPAASLELPFVRHGAYLITGGCRGLGLLVADYLARRFEARLLLSGRSDFADSQRAAIERLDRAGAEAVYAKSDVTNQDDVRRLVEQATGRFGGLHGVIHCAGVIEDDFLVKKDWTSFSRVLAPKVDGARHLDRATQDLPLQVFVLFSSLTSVMGNLGQCDYASANRFLDEFASAREELRRQGRRSGRTVSINWPLWRDGGMQILPASQALMERATGMVPLTAEAGLRALEECLRRPGRQLMVFRGRQERIEGLIESLNPAGEPGHAVGSPAGRSIDEALRSKIEAVILETASRTLKVDIGDIDSEDDLQDYGFDSIAATHFTAELNRRLGIELTPPELFEHASTRAFATFLLTEHGAPIDEAFHASSPVRRMPVATAASQTNESAQPVVPAADSAGNAARGAARDGAQEPIAIIGMSGILPGSADLEQFWQHLAAGTDLVEEIPPERFDWRPWFGDPKREPNKTNSRWGGFMPDVDRFDASFFKISRREAELMDPQQRLFLQTVWKTIENAGYRTSRLAHTKTGLFVGVSSSDYAELLARRTDRIDALMSTGNAHSVLPNRISYLLNLTGPSEPVDTACSSSLVAIHRAVKSIHDGDCELAIAGGVSVLLSPFGFIAFGQAGMLSSDGRCKTFDAGANGYVRGEGCAAILLKRLGAAEADGDHIYGVIRGTAVNHGGRAKSLTAPNPHAQADLLELAYERAGIGPETVSYIEAHGTGTELGDPIEVNGLKKAFAALAARRGVTLGRQYCGLGSVKSNVGHLETAAGIAGVVKVLLAMRAETLPASLHCAVLNPYLKLEESPFYVVRETQAWRRLEDGAGRAIPRRAGVSSFGFGGANAHVVLEEYAPREPAPAPASSGAQLVVLSAKTEERLRASAAQLKAWLEAARAPVPLADLAYTLQTGRDAMEARLALLVHTPADLAGSLQRYLDNTAAPTTGHPASHDDIFTDNARTTPLSSLLRSDEGEIQVYVRALCANERWAQVARLWVSGVDVEWERVHEGSRRLRLELPTYPFARDRFWIPADDPAAAAKTVDALHPLLDRNVSTLKEQRFEKCVRDTDFFVADHVIAGQKLVPAVVYLEMARAGGALAAETPIRQIRNVVWSRPIRLNGEGETMRLRLYPEQGGIDFQITTGSDDAPVLHAQGTLGLDRANGIPPRVDLAAIRLRCDRGIVNGDDLYVALRDHGVAYGPGFRVITEAYRGDQEAIGRLQVPLGLSATFPDFDLHPSVLDGALQTIVAIGGLEALSLPFQLGRFEVFHALPMSCWAWARCVGTRGDAQSYTVSLLDDDGELVARMEELLVRSLHRAERTAAARSSESGASRPMYYAPRWEPESLEVPGPAARGLLIAFSEDAEAFQALKQAGDWEAAIRVRPGGELRDLGGGVHDIDPRSEKDYELVARFLEQHPNTPLFVFHGWDLRPEGSSVPWKTGTETEAELDRGLLSMFMLGRTLAHARGKRTIRIVYPYRADGDRPRPLQAAVAGLLRCLSLERPTIKGAVVRLDTQPTVQMFSRLIAEGWSGDHAEVRYREGARAVRRLAPVTAAAVSDIPLKEQGVYLITGGTGGLGLIFARHLAGRWRARLALCGRSALTSERQQALDDVQALGGEVVYFPADVSVEAEAQQLVADVRRRFGRLDGVIHAAGLLHDGFVVSKSASSFRQVLAPKIDGALNLDRATKDDPLDLFVMFSSLVAATGNVGQSDYASANRFLDEFAALRDDLRTKQERSGRTVSINWPLWREGGMTAPSELKRLMTKTTGIDEIEAEDGTSGFEECLTIGQPQVVVLTGDRRRIEQFFRGARVEADSARQTAAPPATTGAPEPSTFDIVRTTLVELAAGILKVSVSDLDPLEEMDGYGFDSITLTQLTNALNDRYGVDLTPADLYEHPTADALARHLVTQHGPRVKATHELAHAKTDVPPEVSVPPAGEERPAPIRQRQRFAAAPATSSEYEPIAVIGMSGILPGSANLEAFWAHLAAGTDLVEEIPLERFDWRPWYGDPKKEPNKTNSKWGGFMPGIEKFDASFFKISRREAELMDPQQRLFLQTVWETIEDAGYRASQLANTKTGLFVGVSSSDYSELLARRTERIEALMSTGNAHSVLPNRISYFLSLTGPSEPVDTACSSSLVAIHRAILSIHSGDCDMAMAGGVNSLLTPSTFVAFGQAGMLSSDGRCKTFDARANGYVRGEGCAAILLKRLRAAEADGDHIYAVIRGTAVNHGGRAKSLTAPNPNAQADLLQTAYERAGIGPDTVSYIEAHGTGTELGDPIEVNGLKKAFAALAETRGMTLGRQYCGLGSVKSNIGHLETAAGIAGVVKVLLAMREGTLPASLHCDELNPYLRLEESPFYVVRETRPWTRLRDETGREIPRRAGVSSFGFGGANAHVVLEEHSPQARPATLAGSQAEAQLVVLSAKTEERLRAYAARLKTWIEAAGDRVPLPDLAYTLQTGREPMEARLATVVHTSADLAGQLSRYLDGGASGVLVGTVKAGQAPAADAPSDDSVSRLVEERKFSRLAELWVAGVAVPWSKMPGENRRRLSIPTYPFSQERYWVPETKITPVGPAVPKSTIHPLLDANESTFEEWCFTKSLSPSEFVVSDHVIAGQPVLPAVAYLEMARAAAEHAAGRPVTRIRNAVWARPIVVTGDTLRLRVRLMPRGADAADCEISTWHEDKAVVHGQARLMFSNDAPASLPAVPVQQLKDRWRASRKDNEAIYRLFREIGIVYGPAFQVIEELYGDGTEALAKLVLPEFLRDRSASFGLHPSILDGALQTAGAVFAGAESVLLPFGLRELIRFDALPSTCYAHVTRVEGTERVAKVMIRLVDEAGRELVRLSDLSMRPVQVSARAPEGQKAPRPRAVPVAAAGPQSDASRESSVRLEQVQRILVRTVAEVLKVDANQIDLGEDLSDYGFDSITLTEFANKLNVVCDLDLTPADLYEHPSADELSRFLLATYGDRMDRALASEGQTGPAASSAPSSIPLLDEPTPPDVEPESWLEPSLVTTLEPMPSLSRLQTEPRVEPPPGLAFEPIAIIGMDGIFPQSADLPAFWQHLEAGHHLVEEIPADRFDWRRYFGDPHTDRNKTNSKWGGFIPNLDKFDAGFFNISPREADFMDPQQRLFLQTVWKTIEDAGYRPSEMAKAKTGLFVGIATSDYTGLIAASASPVDALMSTGNAHSVLPNRISYLLNLTGPSEPVDTACSSSLVAIHRAVKSIHDGDCELAIAGGVSVLLSPFGFIAFGQAGMLSSDGRCKTFDAGANGYVRGEGCAAILLKRLGAAEADGDHIYGVIRGTAVNHGGRAKSLTAPNPNAQAELLETAYGRAGIGPETVSYIEAHGTGTELGDPIEVNGLKKAFAALAARRGVTLGRQYCGLGSVKSNVGHLETAAGIAGVVKVLLAMRAETLPASLHCAVLNPYLKLEESPFYVVRETQAWRRLEDGAGRAIPRRAGVSSFGFGGANAHVVLEEYAPGEPAPAPASSGAQLVVLSAKTDERLRASAAQLKGWLEAARAPVPLADLAYTLQTGRDAMEARLAIVASEPAELIDRLTDYLNGRSKAKGMSVGRAGRSDARLAADDQDVEAFLATLFEKGKLEQLARFWTSGSDIDWTIFKTAQQRRRLSLPSYPFAEERHWLPDSGPAGDSIEARILDRLSDGLVDQSGSRRAIREIDLRHQGKTNGHAQIVRTGTEGVIDIDVFGADGEVVARLSGLSIDATGSAPQPLSAVERYQPRWSAASAESSTRSSGPVLVFDRDGLWSPYLKASMSREDEQRSAWIRQAPSFRSTSASTFELDFQREDHLRELFETLNRGKGAPDRLLFMSSPRLGDPTDDRVTTDLLDVFAIVKALASVRLKHPATVLFGWSAEAGQAYPGQAAVAGLARSVDLEHPGLSIRTIELEGGSPIGVAELTLAEIASDEATDIEVRRTAAGRFVRRYARLEEPAPGSAGLKHQGVYLITGGLGGVGRALAVYLGHEFKARLSLTGRSPEPDSTAIQQIEAWGAEVLYVPSDVTRRSEVSELVRRTRERFGRIDGVIHCAGVIEDALVSGKDGASFQRVLAPKVFGTVNLDLETMNEPLDFFVMFSSLSAVTGNLGQADYASASRYMDEYALYRDGLRRKGERFGASVSINWPYWAQGGMRASEDALKLFQQRAGITPLSSSDAFKAFAQSVSQGVTQVVVVSGDSARFLEHTTSRRTPPSRTAESGVPRTAAGISTFLRRSLGEVLGFSADAVDPQARFAELGLSSINAMTLLNRIEGTFQLRLFPSELMEYDTVDAFAAYLHQEMLRQPSRVSSPEPAGPVPAPPAMSLPAPLPAAIEGARPLLFLLSTPRAGSTLLRAMLAGHPSVFAPPELHLLPFGTLQERRLGLEQSSFGAYLGEGLIEALKELTQCDVESAVAAARDMADKAMPIADAYAQLQQLVRPRYLMDKSPSYSMELDTLRNAETVSNRPRYIVLFRHPYAVMESMVRNRFDRLLGGDAEQPWEFAEKMWLRMNRNILEFLKEVPADRVVRIRYEELVQAPEPTLRRICTFLEIPFDEAMLTPYEGSRMLAGLHPGSLSIGDPNFLRHDGIEAALADAWRTRRAELPPLRDQTVEVANELGYALDLGEPRRLSPAQQVLIHLYGPEIQWHIGHRVTLEATSEIDGDRFRAACRTLTERHIGLRTRLSRNGGLHQTTEEHARVDVDIVDVSSRDAGDQEALIAGRLDEMNRSIQSGGSLVQIALVKREPLEYELLWVYHHLIGDGASSALLFRELMSLYARGNDAPAVNDRLEDYVKAVTSLSEHPALADHEAFWRRHCTPSHGQLPVDFQAGDIDASSERELRIVWETARPGSDALDFELVAAGLYQALSDWTGQSRVALAHRLHRRHFDKGRYRSVIGCLAGDVPLALDVAAAGDRVARFRRIFHAMPMSGVTYDVLALAGRLPFAHQISAVRLNYQLLQGRMAAPTLRVRDYETRLYQAGTAPRPYALDLIVRSQPESVITIARYSSGVHRESTVRALVSRWQVCVQELAASRVSSTREHRESAV